MEADFEIWLSKNSEYTRHPDTEELSQEHGNNAWYVRNKHTELRSDHSTPPSPLVGKYNLPSTGWGMPEPVRGTTREGIAKIKKSGLKKIIRKMISESGESHDGTISQQYHDWIVEYLEEKARTYHMDQALVASGPGAIKLLLQDDFMENIGHVVDMEAFSDLIDGLAKGTADFHEGKLKEQNFAPKVPSKKFLPSEPYDNDGSESEYERGYSDGYDNYPSADNATADYDIGYEEGQVQSASDREREHTQSEGSKIKIKKSQLRRIIREEKARILEVGGPPDMDAEGWGPNDSEEWERQARFEQDAGAKVEKEKFLAAQYSRWEDHWGIDDDIEAEVIISILKKAYEDIESEWGF
jgi:hypothetical protein